MSSADVQERRAQIREICGVLAFYADRLDRMRAGEQTGEDPAFVDAPTYLAENAAYAYISPWYRIVEPILSELDRHVREADDTLAQAVLDDPEIRRLESKLHRLRAAYELDKEIDQARVILGAKDPSAAIAKMTASQAYWTLTPEIRAALEDRRRIAVIGSGPLPLTTLAIAGLDVEEVVCIERDPLAATLGRRIIEVAHPPAPVRAIEGNIEEKTGIDRFDAVLCAVLLGVDPGSDRHQNKTELVLGVLDQQAPGAVLVMRDPHRLGRLFYPPAALEAAPGLEIRRIEPDSRLGDPYRSAYVTVRKTEG